MVARECRARTSKRDAGVFGKAQRILAYVDHAIGPVVAHPIIHATTRAVEAGGTKLPPLVLASKEMPREALRRALVLAPPSARASGWSKSLPHPAAANASGWMMVKKLRERAAVDRTFVLSDHADWDGLHSAIRATGAERVLLTHGYSAQLARALCEQGLRAEVLERSLGQGGLLERSEEMNESFFVPHRKARSE